MDSVLIILLADDAKLDSTATVFRGGLASGQCKFADETACYRLRTCQQSCVREHIWRRLVGVNVSPQSEFVATAYIA